MKLTETFLSSQEKANEPATAPLTPADIAIFELSRGLGDPAVRFGHGKTIESAVVEHALDRIRRAEEELARLREERCAQILTEDTAMISNGPTVSTPPITLESIRRVLDLVSDPVPVPVMPHDVMQSVMASAAVRLSQPPDPRSTIYLGSTGFVAPDSTEGTHEPA